MMPLLDADIVVIVFQQWERVWPTGGNLEYNGWAFMDLLSLGALGFYWAV